jgi:hypothetical protein
MKSPFLVILKCLSEESSHKTTGHGLLRSMQTIAVGKI